MAPDLAVHLQSAMTHVACQIHHISLLQSRMGTDKPQDILTGHIDVDTSDFGFAGFGVRVPGMVSASFCVFKVDIAMCIYFWRFQAFRLFLDHIERWKGRHDRSIFPAGLLGN